MDKKGSFSSAFRAAFPYTIPVMTGYLFLGISYGIYMKVSGFSFLYPMFMAITIFGGSLEFLAVSLLMSTFAPLQTLLMALVIQARHLFYGLAMLEEYKKPYDRWDAPVVNGCGKYKRIFVRWKNVDLSL